MDSALRHDVNLPVDLPLSVSWERLSGQHSCPLWLTMVSTGLLLRGCRAGVTPAARRPIRPADMLSRLFQHLFRIRHIMSLAFGHSAAQFAAPLCGAPAPFTYACTPQNMPLCGQLQSGREAMGAGRDTEEGDLQGQGKHALLEMSDCVTVGVKAVAFTAKATPYAPIRTPCMVTTTPMLFVMDR